jgi:hypothetical protein
VTNAVVLGGNTNMLVRDLPAASHKVVSDTDEIVMDKDLRYVSVATSKSDSIVAFPNGSLTAGNLSVSNSSDFCSVSVSSMDANDLKDSNRILLLHLTNVLNSKEAFASEDLKVLTDYGELPYIIKTGSVEVTLKNSNPDLKLYACESSGKRAKEMDVDYRDGAYRFTLEISADQPYMIYEINCD